MAIDLTPLPPHQAIAAWQARGHRFPTSFAWQELYAEDHARAFTVAKSAGFDILRDIYAGLDAALKEGSTARDFQRLVTPILQEKGWWGRQDVINPRTGLPEPAQLGSTRRLQLIFDVNMRVSYAAGHWDNFERNKAARPFLRYVHLEGQEHPRLHHQALHNIVLPVDHPFWNTHACPNGWNCHCTLQSLSQRDIDRMLADGVPLRFEPPVVETQPWTNRITGEVRHVPVGIDPGWDHNPGKASWRAQVNESFAAKISAAPPELARAGVVDRVGSSEFDRFLVAPEGDMPVMVLGDAVAGAIGTRSRAVLLSAETMAKQIREHPELTPADYRELLALGETPTLAFLDGPRMVILIRVSDDLWRMAVVKSTASGQTALLTSYRFTSAADVERLLRRSGDRIVLDNR